MILDTDSILGDSVVSVADKTETESARTTDLVPSGVSPLADSQREEVGLENITSKVAIVAFSVGISAIVFGLAGICTAKIRRCPCTCVFGCFAFVFMILYGLAAALLLSLYYIDEDQLNDFCNDNLNLDDMEGILRRSIREAENYAFTVDSELKYAVNTHMCTDFCPCEGGWNYSMYGTSMGVMFADYE